mmetsp:Transcript_33115/g.105549  ORF Transcript_33115/g.105549 Transcript_33115/m.105549 type:complete len:270 (+) Transcript_33115:762-1571(+)
MPRAHCGRGHLTVPLPKGADEARGPANLPGRGVQVRGQGRLHPGGAQRAEQPQPQGGGGRPRHPHHRRKVKARGVRPRPRPGQLGPRGVRGAGDQEHRVWDGAARGGRGRRRGHDVSGSQVPPGGWGGGAHTQGSRHGGGGGMHVGQFCLCRQLQIHQIRRHDCASGGRERGPLGKAAPDWGKLGIFITVEGACLLGELGSRHGGGGGGEGRLVVGEGLEVALVREGGDVGVLVHASHQRDPSRHQPNRREAAKEREGRGALTLPLIPG